MNFILAQSLVAPDLGLAFWLAILFALLLLVLGKYAWGPITRAMNEREETIDESIQRAEKALEEARQIQADNRKARRDAEQEAQRILHEARDEAQRLRGEEEAQTRAKIRQMQEQAQTEIEREKQSALDDLRAEVADLAIQAAEKILDENLNDQRQRRLVDNFLDDLPQN